MRIYALMGLALMLAACDPDLRFRHPVTGEERVCKGAWQHGFASMVDNAGNAQCQDDAWRQGFQRVMDKK